MSLSRATRQFIVGIAGICAVLSRGPLAIAQTILPLAPMQIDQLTAPIALYPDALLAQILMAATYPLEIGEADRWAKVPSHEALKGNELIEALLQQSWEPSVKSLTTVPYTLHMLDRNLNWATQLGNAFLVDQSAVMNSVQRLRQKALTVGKLKSTDQMKVLAIDGSVAIAATDPTNVFVPIYNPGKIFGVWGNPMYPPNAIAGKFPGVEIGPAGFGWYNAQIVGALWNWEGVDWGGHQININPGWFNAMNRNHASISSNVWQHDPLHRGGVPYPSPTVRVRFESGPTPNHAALGSSVVDGYIGAAGLPGTPSQPQAPPPFFGPRTQLRAVDPPPLMPLPAGPPPPPIEVFAPHTPNRAEGMRR